MIEGTSFTIGAQVSCVDGPCGRVTQVVLDPIREAVTHLVVEPDHRQGLGRLVPVEWVQDGGDKIDLQCTRDQFDALDPAEETRFLPGSEGHGTYESEQTLLWPYLGGNSTLPITFETVPVGEVAVGRGERVHATDGEIGQVEGLVVDGRNFHVTHVVLREGHLFGRKDVAIPINAVTEVSEDGIRLSMDKREVGDLPPVDFERRGRA